LLKRRNQYAKVSFYLPDAREEESPEKGTKGFSRKDAKTEFRCNESFPQDIILRDAI